MIKKNLIKIMSSAIIASTVLGSIPLSAMAVENGCAWKQDSTGWWYSTDYGNSYAKGCWKKIDDKWYYFDNDGYMVHDTSTMGWFFGSNGEALYDVDKCNYWGKNLESMNYQKTGDTSYEYSYGDDNKTIVDNLNNSHSNYLEMSTYHMADGQETCSVEFPLNGDYKLFTSKLGLVKDAQDNLQDSDVKIYVDEECVYSESLKSGDLLKDINIDLTGKQKIKFSFKCKNDYGYKWIRIGFFDGKFYHK